MGVWGVGILENDYAADFLDSYLDSCSIEQLDMILKEVNSSSFVDADVAMEALVAICIVLSVNSYCKEEIYKKIEKCNNFNKLSKLLPKAKEALDKIYNSSSSELYELWQESGNFKEWRELYDKLSS